MFSDINLSNLIFRKAPPAWHPYIKLARIDRPIGIWLLLFPCLWSIMLAGHGVAGISGKTLHTILLFTIGAVLMRAAGCIINDLWDMQFDAKVERTKTRPLPSGEVSVANALRFLAVLLGLSLVILLMLPQLTVILGVASMALVVSYPYMKRLIKMPQLFLGLTFNWGVLMGWAAIAETISLSAIFLYLGGVFWTLGYDTIYAHQDKEDDALIGIHSTARLFGESSKFFVAIFYLLSSVFLFLAKTDSNFGILTPLLCSLPLVQAGWQVVNWKMNEPESCLRIFKSNIVYGLLVLLMLAW